MDFVRKKRLNVDDLAVAVDVTVVKISVFEGLNVGGRESV